MGVAVPFSRAFMLLLLALPGVGLLGSALARAISRDRAVRPVLGAGLAVVMAALGVHVASLAAGSLRVGLPVALVGLGAAGLVAEIARRRGGAGAGEGEPPSGWMIFAGLLATAAVAPLALGYHFHDELFLTGHMSIAAQLQNGVYPPRHLAFPDTPLRYHYGFDLVTASVSALLHLPLDRAIDAATLGLFLLAWCLFWALGERLIGRSRAWIVPLLSLFGGGLPLVCTNHPGPMGRVLDICSTGAHYVNPPLASYFFQHPWTLGIPVGATTLLVLTSHRAPRESVRLAALGLCATQLAHSQITLFAGFVPSLLVAEALGRGGFDARRGLRALAVLAVAVAAAVALGGFFVRAPGVPPLEFTLRAGFGDTPAETLLWNLETFGALLPLGAAGLAVLRRDRVVLALLAAGSLVVVNALRFAGSNDIMKFATLGALALAIPSAAALGRLLPDRWTRAGAARGAGAAVLLGLGVLSSGAFAALMGARVPQIPWQLRLVPVTPGPADVQIIAWMRRTVRPGDLVYRAEPAGWAYAQWGGMPVPWIQWTVKAFGFAEERIEAREDLLHRHPHEVDPWRDEGIRFLVLDDTSAMDGMLRERAQAWIKAGEAREVGEVDGLLIVEILPE